MAQYGFAVRDQLPTLPSGVGGLVQVKYNGMLSIIMWDDKRGGFVAWSPRGRCYYSLSNGKGHPVTDYFNERLAKFKNLAFVGETYVVRNIDGKSYMTEFNKTMSIIKNPQSMQDVSRIKQAVFDYALRGQDGKLVRPSGKYVERFHLLQEFALPVGCDGHVIHLPDYLDVEGNFEGVHAQIQGFWDEFIGERGFEGLVLHSTAGEEYKIKFRDTLDAAIIGFRMVGNGRPMCEKCGVRFDAFWLRKLAREGVVERSEWFDGSGRLLEAGGGGGGWRKGMSACPLCGGSVTNTAGPIFGAKIALMSSDGSLVDVADGAQLSRTSRMLDLLEPLYEGDGYLWVRPEVVIEVSYQQLYVESARPVYRFEGGLYIEAGTRKFVSLRPYKVRLREDKTVNPNDLRLEQVSYFVDRAENIQERWRRGTLQ